MCSSDLNEVEDDAAVDIAHHFAGRALNALGVDHSHLAIRCRRMNSFLGDARAIQPAKPSITIEHPVASQPNVSWWQR